MSMPQTLDGMIPMHLLPDGEKVGEWNRVPEAWAQYLSNRRSLLVGNMISNGRIKVQMPYYKIWLTKAGDS